MDKSRQGYLKNYKELRKRINLSLSDADYKKVQYLARLENLKPTTYLGRVVQEKLSRSPYLPKEIKQELSELKLLIRNIANNVNQMAHHSNSLSMMVHERDLLLELKKLEDAVSSYVNKEVSVDH